MPFLADTFLSVQETVTLPCMVDVIISVRDLGIGGSTDASAGPDGLTELVVVEQSSLGRVGRMGCPGRRKLCVLVQR